MSTPAYERYDSTDGIDGTQTAVPDGNPQRAHRFSKRVAIGVASMLAVAGVVAAIVGTMPAGSSASASSPGNLPKEFSASAVLKPKEAVTGRRSLMDTTQYNAVFSKSESADGEWQVDGKLDYSVGEYRITLTLLDNRLYFEQHEKQSKKLVQANCLHQDQLPPYGHLKDSLSNMISDQGDQSGGSCENGAKFIFAGQEYHICGTEALFSKVIGEEFIADIFHTSFSKSELGIPQGLDGKPLVCKQLVSTGGDATTAMVPPADRHLRRQLSSNKICVFIHGAGNEDVGPATSSYTDYWGSVNDYTPYCSTRRYLHQDTKNIGWTDDNLQNAVCDLVAGGHSGQSASNTVVFTHSMGNNILAGAIANGKCTLDSTSSWYESQGPMIGSEAASMAAQACRGGGALALLASLLNYCDGSSTTVAFENLQHYNDASSQMRSAYAAAQQAMYMNVKGAICGTSSWGLNTIYSPALAALDTLVGYNENNDGMVAMSSCTNGARGYIHNSRGFSSNYRSAFYRASINHADGTGRSGNGWWGNDRQPLKWFQNLQ